MIMTVSKQTRDYDPETEAAKYNSVCTCPFATDTCYERVHRYMAVAATQSFQLAPKTHKVQHYTSIRGTVWTQHAQLLLLLLLLLLMFLLFLLHPLFPLPFSRAVHIHTTTVQQTDCEDCIDSKWRAHRSGCWNTLPVVSAHYRLQQRLFLSGT